MDAHLARLELPSFTLVRATRVVERTGRRVALSAPGFEVLWQLACAEGHVVTRAQLMERVWPQVRVSDGSLRQAVCEARAALGTQCASLLESVRGKGYRLAARTPPLRATPCAGLAGRARELEELTRALEASVAGRGQAVLLTGPAGVGKTRLMSRLAEAASQRGAWVLEARATQDEGAPPLWPFVTMLEALDRGSAHARAALAREPAVLALARTDAPAQRTHRQLAGDDQARFLLLEASARVFYACAEPAPLALFIDDLQAADEATLQLLVRLASGLERHKLLLVAACRDLPRRAQGGLGRARDAFAQCAGRARELPLLNFDRDTLAQVLASELGEPLSPALVERVHALSQGNALFSLEVVRLLARAPEAGLLDARPELGTVLARRLHELSVGARETLACAAVLGAEFATVELLALRDGLFERVASELDEAHAAQVLVATADAGRHRFAHSLLHQAALALTPTAQRTRMHAAALRWLELQGPDVVQRRIHELAHHAHLAVEFGEAERASRYNALAAESAYRATAYDHAARLYGRAARALALCPETPAAMRLQLRLAEGEALWAAAAPSASLRSLFEEVAQAASALGEPASLAAAALGCAGFRASCFTPAQLPVQPEPHQLALLERALAALDDGASPTRALLLSALSYALVASGQRTRREALGAESVAIARTLADPALLTRVLQVRALTLCAPGARQEQLAVCDELVALTSAHGNAATRVEALLRRAFAQLAGASFEAAERDALRAAQLAAWEPCAALRARPALWAFLRALGDGQLAEAERLSGELVRYAAGDVVQRGDFLLRSAALLFLGRGQGDALDPLLRAGAAGYPQSFAVHCALAAGHAAAGRREQAQRAFDLAAADDFCAQHDSVMMLTELALLADAATRLDDAERAALVYERLLPYAEQVILCGWEGVVVGPAAVTLGMLCVAQRRFACAERWFERGRRACERLRMPLYAQLCASEYARLLLLRDEPADRQRLVRVVDELAAFADAHGIGCLGVRVEALRTAGLGRARPVPGPVRFDEGLTFVKQLA